MVKRWSIGVIVVLAACRGNPPESAAVKPEPKLEVKSEPKREPTPEPTPAGPRPPADVVARTVASSNQLAVALWRELRTARGNLAIAPASLSIGLALVEAGAAGETGAELRRALHAPQTAGAALADWTQLAGALTDPARKVEVRLATRLFGDKELDLQPAFVQRGDAAVGETFEPADLAHPTTAAAQIEGKLGALTGYRSQAMVAPGTLDAKARLVLGTSLAFTAVWDDPFDAHETKPLPFHASPAATANVSTMSLATAGAELATLPGLKVLRLPYNRREAALVVVLPDRADGLPALEATLDPAVLAGWLAPRDPAAAATEVQVRLPRFTVETPPGLDLVKPLAALGVRRAFGPTTAELAPIAAPVPPLWLAAVVHHTIVKVDELGTYGTNAGAAMAEEQGGKRASFLADHPFLFFVVDRSGLVLVMGRVVDPK